jgi:hypothetical protein
MLPIHIGLVPADDGIVDAPELLRVAAALQMQLTRDFEPVWQTPAVLSAFTSLDQLPPACLPLIIVPPDDLDPGVHAFHTTVKGTPIGLVEAREEGWSLAASHELLEMVCDPQGKRRAMGDSIADSHLREVARDYQHNLPQGQVAYLLEICDPCQDVYYIVNGFQVSDFVFPRYYAPGDTQCGCYSFTGRVKRPREILNGGYITWYTSDDETPVWQAKRDRRGMLTIGPMTIPAPGSSRADVDYVNDLFESLGPPTPHGGDPAAPAEALAERAAREYGDLLRADLARLVDDVYTPQVDVEELIKLLDQLANDNAYYKQFRDQSAFRTTELTKRLGRNVTYPDKVPAQPRLAAMHEWAQQLSTRAAGGKVPAKAAATMMLGQT